MRRDLKTVAAAATLVVGGLLAAPALYAQAAAGPQEGGPMMGGTMQQEGGSMMGGGMMPRMAQMHRMMATCTEMMQAHVEEHGAPRPNEQWRALGGEQPPSPEDRG
jgi:hypothetical protein